ncbi:MAG: hypothetical protein PVH87_28420 [Desulfobacteraceae bacterium]|jgi:hypothetical protein
MNDLTDFAEMCRKICLNIPETYSWRWDEKREMAVVTLDKEDAELVFFPLFKEFNHHWDFSSNDAQQDAAAAMEINSKLGLMPGQACFSSRPVCGLVLFVAWWPWGKHEKTSMRVGLIPLGDKRLKSDAVYRCLKRWLKFE